MCGEQAVAGTPYSLAQQVMHGVDAAVVKAGSTSDNISIRVHATGAALLVSPSSIKPVSHAFVAGDKVFRAMWSGQEEPATILAVESATHARIQLDTGTRAVYSSSIFRLRLASPRRHRAAVPAAAPASVPAAAPVFPVNIETLKQKVATLGVPSKAVVVNAHAALGMPLHQEFAALALQLAATHEVDVLLHGSPEANVDSILRKGLCPQYCKSGPGTFWLTKHYTTAQTYMRGAKRLVAFAVLRPKNWSYVVSPYEGVYTFNDARAILPMFVLYV